MEYREVEIVVGNLVAQRARLESALQEDKKHIWNHMIKIEQLKKELLRKKENLLRNSLRNY